MQVLVPSASVTWQGLKMLGNGLSLAAEHAYGYVLQPLAGANQIKVSVLSL